MGGRLDLTGSRTDAADYCHITDIGDCGNDGGCTNGGPA